MHHASDDEHPVVRDLASFDPRSGSLIERLLFNHRAIVLAICVLVTAVLGWGSTGIRLNASFEKMIPVQHPFIINFLAHRAELSGLGNTLRVAVSTSAGTIYSKEYLETLKRINDELFLVPGVDRSFVKSLWTPGTRWVGVTEEGLEGGPVIPDDYDGSPASLEQLRKNVERSGEIGQLVAGDFRSSTIVLPLQAQAPDVAPIDYQVLNRRLEDIRSRYQKGPIQLHITGFAKVVGDLIDGLEKILVFLGVAILICSVVLYGYTRCLRSTVLVVACSLLAVLWLLGALSYLGYTLDPYSILVPFLIFAIGMSHGAQKMNGIMQDIGRGTHRLVAARYTFRRLFVAGLTALLADAVGFAVLMVIEIRAIQELAITASIGVAILIFTNLVLLPILLSFTGVSAQAAKNSLRSEQRDLDDAGHRKHVVWAFLDRFTRRRWALGAIAVAVLLGGLGALVSTHLRIGDLDPGAPELRADSRYNRDNAFMVQHYAASSDVYVVMVRTPQFKCVDYDTLARVDLLESELQNVKGVESVMSYPSLARRMSVGMNEGSLKWYELSRTQSMLNNIATRVPRELLNYNCDLLTVFIYLQDHKSETLDAVVAAVQDFARRYDTTEVKFLSAAGNAGIEAATNIVVKKANTEMLLLVYLAVIVLAFITFRSMRAVLCAIVPLLLTSILCEALMVWLGMGVKVATLPVIALGVGIGIDYSLYILTVTLAHLRKGLSLSAAYYRALLFTGRVVALTGITLGLAVATWVLSPIKFQADMGILLCFMFIWNMLGAGILLPALAHFLLRQEGAAKTDRSKTGRQALGFG